MKLINVSLFKSLVFSLRCMNVAFVVSSCIPVYQIFTWIIYMYILEALYYNLHPTYFSLVLIFDICISSITGNKISIATNHAFLCDLYL